MHKSTLRILALVTLSVPLAFAQLPAKPVTPAPSKLGAGTAQAAAKPGATPRDTVRVPFLQPKPQEAYLKWRAGFCDGTAEFYIARLGEQNPETHYLTCRNGVGQERDGYGRLVWEVPYVGGKESGIKRSYFESGVLRSEAPMVNGLAQGVQRSYFESGVVRTETPVIDGVFSGTAKSYRESRALEKETPYIKGVVHGVVKLYRESGRIKDEIPYVDGKENGVARSWRENGNLQSETTFQGGEKEGLQTLYFESGAVGLQIPFTKGVKQGKVREYDEEGRLLRETSYSNGQFVSAKVRRTWNDPKRPGDKNAFAEATMRIEDGVCVARTDPGEEVLEIYLVGNGRCD